MIKLPWFISADYVDEWIIGFQSAAFLEMDADDRTIYKQQVATAMQVRYNTLRGMDTERLAESPTVRSLLHDAAFFFDSALNGEGEVSSEWLDQVDKLLDVLDYVLGEQNDVRAVEEWEKFKERLNNDHDE